MGPERGGELGARADQAAQGAYQYLVIAELGEGSFLDLGLARPAEDYSRCRGHSVSLLAWPNRPVPAGR